MLKIIIVDSDSRANNMGKRNFFQQATFYPRLGLEMRNFELEFLNNS